jgi:hypothetical protein
MSAEAQIKLRVATWNIEDFNYYKSIGQVYSDDSDLKLRAEEKEGGVQVAIQNQKDNIIAGEVISNFMKENEIDLLFIQEFIPYTISEIGRNKLEFKEFDEIKDLDANFILKKKCYYHKDYLDIFKGDKRLRNQLDIDNFKSNATPLTSNIPACGECYAVIYNKDKVDNLSSELEAFTHSKMSSNSFEAKRPPSITTFIPKINDKSFQFIEDEKRQIKKVKIYNYHAMRDKKDLKTDEVLVKGFKEDSFEEILSFNIGDKISTDKEYILFLGDMNKKTMKGGLPRREKPKSEIDYIYANNRAKLLLNQEDVVEVKKNADEKDFESEEYYSMFNKNYLGGAGGKSHFSDHNPLYTELIFGGKIETQGYKGTVNRSTIEYFPSVNLEIKQTGGKYFLDNDKYDNEKTKVLILKDSDKKRKNQGMKPILPYEVPLSVYRKEGDTVLYWRKDGKLKGETILRKVGHEIKPGVYPMHLEFIYNDFWYVEKEIIIKIPKAITSTEAPKTSLGTESNTSEEIRSFMQKRGNHCEQNGDEVWMIGENFIAGDDVTISLPSTGTPLHYVDGKKDINEKGNFNKYIGYANEIETGLHTADFYVYDEVAASTQFNIVPCTKQKDPWDDGNGLGWLALLLALAILAGAFATEFAGAFAGALAKFAEQLGFKIISTTVVTSANGLAKLLVPLAKKVVTVFFSASLALTNSSDQIIVAEIPLTGKVIEYSDFINKTTGEGVTITKDNNSIKITGTTTNVLKYIKKELDDIGAPVVFITKNSKGMFEVSATDKVNITEFNNIFKTPVAYNVTGSGMYKNKTNGRVVGLDGSEKDVTYQLKKDTTNVGTPIQGTGGAISFGEKTEGTYTVIATRRIGTIIGDDLAEFNNISLPMLGSAVVTVEPLKNSVLYVNASVSGGKGDGSSWANAYSSLSDALALAHNYDEIKTIKVAKGTYKPTKKPFKNGVEIYDGGDRDYTFHIPNGTIIEGGYDAGSNTRDIKHNLTILSGDIGIPNDISDNCYHVVLISNIPSNTTTVDGFSVAGGNANGDGYIRLVENETSFDVTRSNGAGVYIVSDPTGTNILTNNRIENNFSKSSGGGIYGYRGTSILTNNIICRNTIEQGGGAGFFVQSGTSTLTNNLIAKNRVRNGTSGGGITCREGTYILTNNTIAENSSNAYGGGILIEFSTVTLTNNIFAENNGRAIERGKDFISSSSKTTFKNNLLELQAADYTRADHNELGNDSKDNIFGQNPLFVNPDNPAGPDGIYFTEDDGFRLQSGSPCINKGTSEGAPAKDILGKSRPNGNITIGAYQY